MTTDRSSIDLATLEQHVSEDPGAPDFPLLAEAYRRTGRLHDARRVAVAGLAARPDDGAGRLALGITLMDLGEAAAAHYELERVVNVMTGGELDAWLPPRDGGETFEGLSGVAPAFAAEAVQPVQTPPEPRPYGAQPHAHEVVQAEPLGEEEFEQAFAQAESVPDEMVDANRIAEAALEGQGLDEPEGFTVGDSPNFATETMARLLEDQGDLDGAEAIRDRLGLDGGGVAALEAAPLHSRPMDAAELPADFAGQPVGAADADRRRIIATLERWLANVRRASA